MWAIVDEAENLVWGLPILAGVVVIVGAHARELLGTADATCLEELRRGGLVGGDVREQWQQLTRLSGGAAAAVWQREQVSVQMYIWSVAWLFRGLPRVRWLRREISRIVIYQAQRYAEASTVLETLRDDSRWEAAQVRNRRALSKAENRSRTGRAHTLPGGSG